MTAQRLLGVALLGLFFVVSPVRADSVTMVTVTKKSQNMGGATYYWVEIEGTFTATMLPTVVRPQRLVGNPAEWSPWGNTTQITFNGTTVTFKATSASTVIPGNSTIRVQLYYGSTAGAGSAEQNISFP